MQPAASLPYLENLNPAQREAVLETEGPLLVLAGAGTGKTRVLTTRLGHILHTGLAAPSQILAVTFTNKAAQEMRERLKDMPPPLKSFDDYQATLNRMYVGTFHALSSRMLRRHAELVGLKSNYTILDEDDQIRLVKQIAQNAGIDMKGNPPRLLCAIIQKWKDKGLAPAQVTAADAGGAAGGRMHRLYAEYQDRLRALNACDFGDLLLHVITIFRDPKNAGVLAYWKNRFRYILVDEYQDTNTAQYMWLRLLAQGNSNICCVGDDDQSIYGWRGAQIGNILKFGQDFPGAKIIRLEQNYRSTQAILSAANAVIAHNKGRLGKELWSADAQGEKISLRGVWDGRQEAQAVAEEIENLRRGGAALRHIAVLVRASHQTREFEERFMRESIPYRVVGGLRFYERQEIRDALAYLRVTAQPDDDLAFERIVNTPKRGIGGATMEIVRKAARARGVSLYAALQELVATDALKPRSRATLRDLVRDFDRWRARIGELPHAELAQLILDESGYTAMWTADASPEAAGRLENLREFTGGMREFESLGAFLEHVALVMDNTEGDDPDMVSVMTLHAAKGLEFDAVFLPGWEEGVFPNQRTMDESGEEGLEEERRLAYVGITRARKRAYISFAANRVIYGNWTACLPSRFIDELPRDRVDAMIDTGLYDSGGTAPARGRAARFEEQGIARAAPRLGSSGGFSIGERVFHQKFGAGTITAADGDRLDILFDKAGRKKVLESFVEKAEGA